MSSSPNRASQSPGKRRPKDVSLDLTTARRMLPLVKSIVADIVDTQNRLSRLVPERDALDDNRRVLDWASRQRRYAVHDEFTQAEKALHGARLPRGDAGGPEGRAGGLPDPDQRPAGGLLLAAGRGRGRPLELRRRAVAAADPGRLAVGYADPLPR
jgi:hypothetical protein